MNTTLDIENTSAILSKLEEANKTFQQIYPGDLPDRQPVHTVYGGANLFKSDIAAKMRIGALNAFNTYAPNFAVLARALELPGHQLIPDSEEKIKYMASSLRKGGEVSENATLRILHNVYEKVKAKLETEALEDFRIDFEDGFGNRPDDEEDQTAINAAMETAKGMAEKSLSPFIGIRIKPFTEDLRNRGIRTLDIYLSTLLSETGGKLPNNFVVMLPKVTITEQPDTLAQLLDIIEVKFGLENGSIKMEMMVETTQSINASDGTNPLLKLVKAAKGRCIAMHFGTYDYTASCNITAKYQTMAHPVCDFAHHMTKVALSHTGVWLSDGATNVMPVGPNKGELTDAQMAENRSTVHAAWKLGYDHNRHSLWNGFYQGWDLHPAQLVTRYAAVYTFFLESYDDAVHRLKHFVDKSAQATLSGDIFDDAATGQGLLNFFLKALNCGAITEEEILPTGLTIEEVRLRSFYKILEKRRG
ncbi:MAG: citrate lyase beta subunit [Parvicellaceae bacterium]|jgi:citrate lyase beta subunit